MAAAIAFAAAGGLGCAALAQVRVAQWNVTNWSASATNARKDAFKTAFYGVVPATTGSPPVALIAAGQSMSPDIVIIQEVEQGGAPSSVPWSTTDRNAKTAAGQASVTEFLLLLNSASGSPGDWVAAPYVANQGDDGNALFYRTSKFTLQMPIVTLGTLGTDVCGAGNCGVQTNQSPRDNQRWRLRVFGYDGTSPGAELYIYGAHMKAGDTPDDQTRRIPEASRIRADAQSLPPGANFLLGGDFNIQSSNQTAYENLVLAPLSGQFFDPINRPGSWNNNCNFRNIHTQEPTPSATAAGSPPSGGMDDRHDQILFSATLRDGQGMSYIPYTPGGNILAAFVAPAASCAVSATATAWFDPNHSYRCWGNDGNHYNLGILNLPATPTDINTQVGQTIAQALITTCNGNGHLPVYLDLKVPAKLGAPSGTVDLGTVVQNSTTTYTLQVSNAADVARFSKDGTGWGIDPLSYSLAITAGPFAISGSTGPFERAALSPVVADAHTITLDTSLPGAKTATLTITTDDPEHPTRLISIIANVEQPVTVTGACCTLGNCTTTTQANCGGAYQGDNIPCTPTLCPQPMGSCCDGDGHCTVGTQVACTGVYQGNGTNCSPNPCPQPGACCNAATGNCRFVLQAACPPDTFNGSSTCTPSPCPQPTGACCNGTSCTSATQPTCGGVFQGPATVCGTAVNPTTCCPANFNRIDGVEVADIFAFLAVWFNAGPAADFDQSGNVTVSDIFAFLTAWFARC